MIRQSDILADLHIHTLASLHAYSTVKECIEEAAEKGLKYIAITDHYYNDGTDLFRKNEVSRIRNLEKRVMPTKCGIKVIGGAEFNLAHEVREWEKLKKLKWKLVGMHGWFFDRDAATAEDVLGFYQAAAVNYDAFAHIERDLQNINHGRYGSGLTETIRWLLDEVVDLAKREHIVLELNEYSLVANEGGAADRLAYWLKRARELEVPVSLGTDSHYCGEIGSFTHAIDLLNELQFPKEQVLNCNEKLLEKRFG